MLGVAIEKTSILIGDNLSVLLNTSVPSCVLKKKHLGCSYHRVREAVAGGIVKFWYTPSNNNFADVLTKPLPVHSFQALVKPWLFRRAKVIEEEVEKQARSAKMATRIPTDEEQDEEEEMQRIRDFIREFQRQLNALKDMGRYKECVKAVLQDIRAIPRPIVLDAADGTEQWRVTVRYMNRRNAFMQASDVIERHPREMAFASNAYELPLHYEFWRWSATSEHAVLPFQVLGIEF